MPPSPPRGCPFQRNMCSDNVNLPKEANKAKCFVISCFVLCASPGAHAGDGCTTKKRETPVRLPVVMQQLHHLTQCACAVFARSFLSCTAHTCGSSIFSMIGFFADWAGAIGAVCGILACIGSSILMCCAPRTPQEGGGKFCAVRKSTLLAATPNPTPYAARAV